MCDNTKVGIIEAVTINKVQAVQINSIENQNPKQPKKSHFHHLCDLLLQYWAIKGEHILYIQC